LKGAEREALFKSFTLFFISLSLLFGVIVYLDYEKDIREYHKEIYRTMKLCSYDLNCSDYKIDFVPKESKIFDEPIISKRAIYADFDIPDSKDFRLRLELPIQKYDEHIVAIYKHETINYLIFIIISVVASFLFSLYSLLPLRKALHTTEEFARDILHDFNTPLSVIRLNISSLKRKCDTLKELDRIDKSVESILLLQQHMREYLDRRFTYEERFELSKVVREIADMITTGKSVEVIYDIKPVTVMTKRKEFVRILDNILENAVKYGKREGAKIEIVYRDKKLYIRDNGRGIKRVSKIFNRFYRESTQLGGSGIGMNIVSKLSKNLNIEVSLKSREGEGTTVILDLANIVIENVSSR